MTDRIYFKKKKGKRTSLRRKRKKEKSPQKNEIALPDKGICLFQLPYYLFTLQKFSPKDNLKV